MNLINNKIFTSIVILIILFNFSKTCYCAINPPITCQGISYNITSSYGPRSTTGGTFFHPGIDYGRGAGWAQMGDPIRALNSGTITGINISKTKYIAIIHQISVTDSDVPKKEFMYLHIFPNNIYGQYFNDTIEKCNNENKLSFCYAEKITNTINKEQVSVLTFISSAESYTGLGHVFKVLSKIRNIRYPSDDKQVHGLGEEGLKKTDIIIMPGLNDVLETKPNYYIDNNGNCIRNEAGDDDYYIALDPVLEIPIEVIIAGNNGKVDTEKGNILTKNEVSYNEIIAPMGNSGGNFPHLHLQFGNKNGVLENRDQIDNRGEDGRDNPLIYILHDYADKVDWEPVIKFPWDEPKNKEILFHTKSHDKERIKVKVNYKKNGSCERGDYNRIKIFVYPTDECIDFTINEVLPNEFEEDIYMINEDRDPIKGMYSINYQDPSNITNDPFRAEFDLGGIEGEVNMSIENKDVDDVFPPFLNSKSLNNTSPHLGISYDGKRTGVQIINATDFNFVFNQWNTKICSNFDRNNDGIADDAILNIDDDTRFSARYPDGRWRIVAIVEDIDWVLKYYGLQNLGPVRRRLSEIKRFFTIDNFRPYLKKVSIKQKPNIIERTIGISELRYEAEWLIENPNSPSELKLKQKGFRHLPWGVVRNGEVIITLNFSEAIAFKEQPNISVSPTGFKQSTFSGETFYMNFIEGSNNPEFKYDPKGPHKGKEPIEFKNANISIRSFKENSYYDTVEIKFDIPKNDENYNGEAILSVFIKDLAGNGLLKQDYLTIITDIPGNLHRNNKGEMQGTPGNDTLHHFWIDTSPPSVFAYQILNFATYNPSVMPEIIIEDLTKISYVKIDWGDGKVFEKIYDPPVDKVVEYNTYYQKCWDQEYIIKVEALDGAGNHQTNITIDGEEFSEVKFTVLALKSDFPVGFAANRRGHTVTAFNLDPCGNAGKAIAQIPVGNTPFGIEGRGDGRIYVTNSGDGTFSVIDTNYDPENDTFDFEEVPGSPFTLDDINPSYIVLTPDGSRAYIADRTSGIIKTINLVYWTDFLDPRNQFTAIRPHSDLSQYNKIYQIKVDLPGGGAGGTGGMITDIEIDPAGRRLYVVVQDGAKFDANGGWIDVYNIEYIISQHPYPSRPKSFHGFLDRIPLIRLEKGPLDGPTGITFTPDGDLAYVTAEGEQTITGYGGINVSFDGSVYGGRSTNPNPYGASGGIVVIDPQVVYDPSLITSETGGAQLIDYIEPQIPGSNYDMRIIPPPTVDWTNLEAASPAGSSIIHSIQMTTNWELSHFESVYYKFPVNINGAREMAISPDGRKAYITFGASNNYGIMDLEPSFTPGGFDAQSYAGNNFIYTSSEAILHSWDPTQSIPGEHLFPDEIIFSRDGHHVIISNLSYLDNRITIVNTNAVNDILGLVKTGQLSCNPYENYPYKVPVDHPPKLSTADLKKYPFDNLPSRTSALVEKYGELTLNVPAVEGIDFPRDISIIPSYDKDEDLKYGGASDLVEAKNRFNSLLKLPPCLDPLSLISSKDDNIMSPAREDLNVNSKAVRSPWGDDLNNYLPENRLEDPNQEGRLINGVLMPTEGPGYRHDYGYDPYNSDNAGTLALINLLEKVGRKWLEKYPDRPRIVYCDLSRPGGGQFMDIGPEGGINNDAYQRHAAHQNGLDADVRYMRTDLTENPFDFVLSNNSGNERNNTIERSYGYHEEYTRDLINLFIEEDEVEVVFVDPMVAELAEEAGSPFDSPRLIVRGERDDLEEGSRRDHDDHFSVRIKHSNDPPVARVPEHMVATEGETVELDGSASSDPDNDKLFFEWTQREGLEVSLSDPYSPKPTFECPSSFSADELVFSLAVYDGELWSPEVTVTIKVNGKPVAEAKMNPSMLEVGEQATLDGSKSYDPDGDQISYLWTQTSGLPALIDGIDQAVANIIAPWEPSLNEQIVLIFSLTVADDYAESEPAEVSITINPPPNNPPIADAGPDQYVIIGSSEQVTLDASGSSDLDYTALIYNWSQIDGPKVSLNDHTDPKPTFSILDFAASTQFTFSLSVSDGKDSSVDIVNVKLLIAKEGNIVINEIITDPKQDWSLSGFADYPESGGIIDNNDEWIEIYNDSETPIDLTGWSIIMNDSNTAQHYIGIGSGVEVYSKGSSLNNLLPKGFLVVGNPDGEMDNDCFIELIDSHGNVIDTVEIGDDYEEDGLGDGAPEAGKNGASVSFEDEAIARVPDGIDTDHDVHDFKSSYATPKDLNFMEYYDEFDY